MKRVVTLLFVLMMVAPAFAKATAGKAAGKIDIKAEVQLDRSLKVREKENGVVKEYVLRNMVKNNVLEWELLSKRKDKVEGMSVTIDIPMADVGGYECLCRGEFDTHQARFVATSISGEGKTLKIKVELMGDPKWEVTKPWSKWVALGVVIVFFGWWAVKKKKKWLFWMAIAVVCGGTLATVRPVLADVMDGETRLGQYVVGNDIEVGIGNGQIFYVFDEKKTVVTDTKRAKGAVVTRREYIVWMEQIDGLWQIFSYHIPTKSTRQLTQGGNNVNPKVDGENIVWESWMDGGWKIFLFDGKSIDPIGSGMNAQIEGNYVVFASKDDLVWKAVLYGINQGKSVDVASGEEHPELVEGLIRINDRNSQLKADDYFAILGQGDEGRRLGLSEAEIVTEEEIRQELEILQLAQSAN